MKKEPEVLAAAAAAANTASAAAATAATEGLPPSCFHQLHDRVLLAGPKGKQNALTVCDYVFSLRSEVNPSDHYRKDLVMLLCRLSTFFDNDNNNKSFEEITRQDLLSFLDSCRKPEHVDPLHKWIGTWYLNFEHKS
jgi:hypothetical protein